RLAVGLQQHGVRPGLVVTSPFLRALQTAEELLRHWSAPAPEVQTADQLAPGGGRRKLARFLANLGVDPVAVVGHQPDLGAFIGWLIGNKTVQIDLAKGGVAFLTCPDKLGKGSAALVWMVTPEWLGLTAPGRAASGSDQAAPQVERAADAVPPAR